MLLHGRASGSHGGESRRQVRGQRVVPFLIGGEMGRFEQYGADAVDQTVQPPRRLGRFANRFFHRLDRRRIDDLNGRLQGVAELRERFGISTAQSHAGTGSVQTTAHFRTDASAGAQDEIVMRRH